MTVLVILALVGFSVGWPMANTPRRLTVPSAALTEPPSRRTTWAVAAALVLACSAMLRSPAVVVVAPLVVFGWRRERGRRNRRRARTERAEASLAFVEAVGAELRAGGSLVGAATNGVGTGPWSAVRERVAAGRPLATTMREVVDPDVAGDEQLIAVTIAALDTSGAPAGEALERLSDALRARHSAAEEARTQAQQALSSSAVLAALPLVFGIAAALIEPDVGALYRSSWLGAVCIALAMGSVMAGWEWMHRLLDVADG